MAKISISANELVVFEGKAKTGKNVGKPYAFVKIDRRLANSDTFVDACKKAGARVMGGQDGAPDDSFEVQQ